MEDKKMPLWKRVVNGVLVFLLVLLVWTVLGGTTREELGAGVVVALIVVLVSSSFFTMDVSRALNPFRLINYATYLLIYLVETVKAMGMMFHLVIDGDIAPSIIRIAPRVGTEFGRASLSNAITMTPGTMVIDEDEDHIYVHAIRLERGADPESVAMPYNRYVTGFAE